MSPFWQDLKEFDADGHHLIYIYFQYVMENKILSHIDLNG